MKRVRRRKVVVYVATSADGYIARPDGGVEWLNRPRTAGDYGMRAFWTSVDTTLMGRKTWEMGRKLGGSFDARMENYVFSRRRRPGRSGPVQFASEPPEKVVRRLRASPGKHICLMGGAELVGHLLDKGEIDEFIIHVVPTFIGEGIPLIAPRRRDVPLELLSSRRFRDGLVRLRYRVAASGKASR